MSEPKKVIVEFAPGCFDDFDGTQEELDQLIEEIKRMATSGEMIENSHPVEYLDDVNQFNPKSDKRNLQ
jgi:hypothetical protein